MGWNKKGGGMDDFFDILFTLIGGFFIFFFLFGVIDNLTKDNEDITLELLEQVKTKEVLLSILEEPYANSILAETIYQEEEYSPEFKEVLNPKFSTYLGKIPTDVFIEDLSGKNYYELQIDPHYGAANEVIFTNVTLLNNKVVLVRIK